MSNKDLEKEADELLAPFFKDKRRNKSQTDPYPVLSESQLKRRASKEIPFSSLSVRQAKQSECGQDEPD